MAAIPRPVAASSCPSVSRFSRRTAKQAGHLLFEILVEILSRRWRRFTRFRLKLKLGFGLRLLFRLEFRFNARLEIAHRGPCACVAHLASWRCASRRGQRIGDWRPAFGGG